MLDTFGIANVSFRPARLGDRPHGLLGFVAFDVGDAVRLDGMALRRTLTGRLALTFPERRDNVRAHAFIKPLTRDARRELEERVIGEVRRQGYVL